MQSTPAKHIDFNEIAQQRLRKEQVTAMLQEQRQLRREQFEYDCHFDRLVDQAIQLDEQLERQQQEMWAHLEKQSINEEEQYYHRVMAMEFEMNQPSEKAVESTGGQHYQQALINAER